MRSLNTKEIECTITGKVQGVNFRNFAKTYADKLDIVGTVENLSNGSVEVVAQGTQEKLEEFIDLLKKGPYFSSVEDVDVKWHSTHQDSFIDFNIIR